MEACYQHPGVESVAFCSQCANPICAVCQFDGPTGARCPTCAAATRRPTKASGAGAALSLALAVGSGLAFVLVFVIAVVQEESAEREALIGAVFLLSFIGTIAGLAFGLIAREEARRQGSVIALVGIASNGLLLAALLVLTCVGTFME